MTDQAPELLPMEALPLNIGFAVEYLDGVMSCEQAEIQRMWKIVRAHLLTRPPSERPVAWAYEFASVIDRSWKETVSLSRPVANDDIRNVVPLFALTAERPEAGMIQADSSASEKVCDHPSTEKAAYDIVDGLRDNANDCEDMSRWAAPELSPLLRRAADEIERLRAAPPTGQVIANPANSLRSLPESSDPSLLGRETVREKTIEECAKIADKEADLLLFTAARLKSFQQATVLHYTEAELHDQAGTAIKTVVDKIRALASLSPLKE